MLSIILALLNSAGFGTVVGAIGGFVNRHVDLANKRLDQAHELAVLNANAELMDREWKYRGQVASIEAEASVRAADAAAAAAESAAAFAAMQASFEADRATYGDKLTDRVRGMMRPVLTFLLATAMLLITGACLIYVWRLNVAIKAESWLHILQTLISWFALNAGVAIGWWFAHRPGPVAQLGGKAGT